MTKVKTSWYIRENTAVLCQCLRFAWSPSCYVNTRGFALILSRRGPFTVSGRGRQRYHDQERAAPSTGKARNTLSPTFRE